MVPCPSWMSWLSLCLMAVLIQQFTECPPTLTCTSSGTATTQYHPNTVWLVPYTTGPELFVQAFRSCRRRRRSAQSSGKIQVPSRGSQWNKFEDQISSPKQQQKRHQQHWKQYYKQSKTLYGWSLYQRAE